MNLLARLRLKRQCNCIALFLVVLFYCHPAISQSLDGSSQTTSVVQNSLNDQEQGAQETTGELPSEQQSEDTATASQNPIEQITISTQQTLMGIRYQLRIAEDAMFDRFNELNSDDQFDIRCKNVRYTHSYIPRRECEPRFLTSERQSSTVHVMTQLRDSGASGGGGLGGGTPAGQGDLGVASSLNLEAIDLYSRSDGELRSQLGQKYEEMNAEMFRIANEDPEFLRSLMRVDAYRKALIEATEERWSDD